MLRRAIQRAARAVGLDVTRPAPGQLHVAALATGRRTMGRSTMHGALANIKALGFHPGTVFDVGAADGTPALFETFPSAQLVLIEPLEEFRDPLRELADLRRAHVFMGAAGAVAGETVLNVHPDLFGSSVLREEEDTDVNGVERVVPQTTLDDLRLLHRLEPPFLLKIDTQGGELEVLEGAWDVLRETEVAILELSFFQFFTGGPLAADVIAFMSDQGLVPYDVIDWQYRPLDGAMSQVDMVFVRATSGLRRHHVYANPEQRAAQTARFRSRQAQVFGEPLSDG